MSLEKEYLNFLLTNLKRKWVNLQLMRVLSALARYKTREDTATELNLIAATTMDNFVAAINELGYHTSKWAAERRFRSA